MADISRPPFVDKYDEIAALVEKQRTKWKFKASVMRDFDDIKSEIIAHVWAKWHLYDPARPLAGWVATIVKHQFTNILRDVYLSTSSPCSQCVCNLGEGVCSQFGVQGIECPLYAKWYKSKRHIHNAKLPLSLNDHEKEVSSLPSDSYDLEAAIEEIHNKLKKKLTDSEWAIYQRLFIMNKNEEDTATELGFRSGEKGRAMGYKRIRQVKTLALKLTKDLIKEFGLGGLCNHE